MILILQSHRAEEGILSHVANALVVRAWPLGSGRLKFTFLLKRVERSSVLWQKGCGHSQDGDKHLNQGRENMALPRGTSGF